MPPAKRSSKRFPNHIDPDKLPTGPITYDPRGKGRWIYRKSQGRGNRGKEIRFGNAQTTLAQIWQMVESIETGKLETFRAISLALHESEEWTALAPRTQTGYLALHRAICEAKTKHGGKVGDLPLNSWTPAGIKKFMRSRPSRSSAAAEVRYIKRVFSWAISEDIYTKANPAKGVDLRGYAAKPRLYYVPDDDYCLSIAVAPLHIGLAAHFSYLSNKRRTDILNLTRQQITPLGIDFRDNKTGKLSIVEWSDELRMVVDMIISHAGDTMFLWPALDDKTRRYSDRAFDNAWQKVRKQIKKEGGTPFKFKDIRSKHSSDLESDDEATQQLLHSDGRVTKRHYRCKPTKIHSLR